MNEVASLGPSVLGAKLLADVKHIYFFKYSVYVIMIFNSIILF